MAASDHEQVVGKGYFFEFRRAGDRLLLFATEDHDEQDCERVNLSLPLEAVEQIQAIFGRHLRCFERNTAQRVKDLQEKLDKE